MNPLSFSSVAAILRSYSNVGVRSQIDRLLSLGVGTVILVCNTPEDKGITAEAIADITDKRFRLIGMETGYGWSAALNRGIEAAEDMVSIDYVLNISNEALIEKEHLQSMLRVIKSPDTYVVGTTFAGIDAVSRDAVFLGETYHLPRNTGMLIKMSAFDLIGREEAFALFCEKVKGMEDYEFLIQVLMSGGEIKCLDLKIPLLVGVHHDQKKKEGNELFAKTAIMNHLTHLHDTPTVKECLEHALSELSNIAAKKL